MSKETKKALFMFSTVCFILISVYFSRTIKSFLMQLRTGSQKRFSNSECGLELSFRMLVFWERFYMPRKHFALFSKLKSIVY